MARNAKNRAGFMSIEAIGALVVFFILLVPLTALMKQGLDKVEERSVASQIQELSEAVSSYAKSHYAQIMNNSTPTTSLEVTIADLKAEGLLPDSFATQNPWGQAYRIFFLEPNPDEVQGIILTYGGFSGAIASDHFLNARVPNTAAMAGSLGGFIPSGVVPGQSATSLRGAFGGWEVDLSATDIPVPTPGHVGGMVFMQASQLSQDYLYRFDVPGHPELNEMHTELDMTDHGIENVRNVDFVTHTLADFPNFCTTPADEGRFFLHDDEGFYVCRDGRIEVIADTGNSIVTREVTIANHDDFVTKPVCPVGTDLVPRIYVSVLAAAADIVQASPLQALQAWATDVDATQWQVHLRVKADNLTSYDTWENPPADAGKIQVITTCEHP